VAVSELPGAFGRRGRSLWCDGEQTL